MTDLSCDILIIGGGMVGLTAALALGESGHEVAVCAPDTGSTDPRTTAVLESSVQYLDGLGIWDGVAQTAHPLRIMRLVDATSRLFRFQQMDFNASEIGLPAFGYNVRNQTMLAEIRKKIEAHSAITLIDGTLERVERKADTGIDCKIKTKAGQTNVETGFLVGADGKNSIVREYFGHGERRWHYPQTAIVLDFEHELPSHETSTEFHTESGPFTIVPHSPNAAGLVWLETPQGADEVLALDTQVLQQELERKMHSWLGKIMLKSKPFSFPMSGMVANCFGAKDHALIGEAAHVFPPIGAQGFNLGVRDISTLVSVMQRYTVQEDRGAQYHRQRTADINARTYGVDLLNRTLLSDFLPAQMAKSVGMTLLARVAPVRKQAMKAGIGPFRRQA